MLLVLSAVLLAAGGATFALVGGRTGDGKEDGLADALAALSEGDYERVRARLAEFEQTPGRESHASLLRGGLFLRGDDPAAALREFGRLEPAGEIRVPALLLTGEALYKVGWLPEAESCFAKLLKEEPDHPLAHRWLAAVYYDLGAMDRAEIHLRRLAELQPQDFKPHQLLGVIHKDFEQYDEATRDFRAALERNPPPEIRQSVARELAACLMKNRDFAGALDALDSAADDAEVEALRSECLWSLGRHDEAREALARAVALNPESLPVLRWQALTLVYEGRFEEAVPLLRRVVEIDPHHVECRYQLALAHQRLGDEAAYRTEIEQVERSKALLTRLTELSRDAMERPHDADLRDRMASVCDDLGRPQLAASWRRMADTLRRQAAAGRNAAQGT